MKNFYFIVILGICFASDCEIGTKVTVMDCYQKCRSLYNGNRNYYNETSGVCDVVAECSQTEQYSYLTNKCSPIVQDVTDFPKVNKTNRTEDNSIKLTVVIILVKF
jgi:hypothetical protein